MNSQEPCLKQICIQFKDKLLSFHLKRFWSKSVEKNTLKMSFLIALDHLFFLSLPSLSLYISNITSGHVTGLLFEK